ncbi:MAG TPA: PhnD/SsuA/transferrin family substrate-binding protein [Cyclobacteriaceae bacterium]|nr:PhnD/SsuA/transferrin family substrate-binding protein [Cyclobacteriaceae bacterium]HMV07921.1 PhnD/SsuA/transferrin family substrate-binding protein [Cyclobacteriaceae bacterium]HMV88189.1 PhnD/SsuA/transferrin family substrate-binding protein [Cyclobacteriaceae bacterium]HMW99055.1 PhnD/SsuA/transferrin family substrate-binding protein [Cyclobacteriaceae bacterium]HMX48312.1 PhnD/SsuA/transferrin family substrate-binding protein [Cyclobacteriaceae bacterium]
MRLPLLIILCFLSSFAYAQGTLSNARPLVVATYQYADNPRLKNIEPFAIHLAETAGIKTTVKSYPTVHELLEAMRKSEVDVAFINTFGYLLLREITQNYEVSATLNLPEDAASVYRSVIVSPKENHFRSLQQAVDRAADNFLILVSPGSTSGNLMPRLKLASMLPDDPEKLFVEVQYAERHDAALKLALEEKFALASCGIDEYNKLGADTARFDLLWKSGPIPLGPVVVRKDLSENLKISLQRALLELREQNPEALEAIKSGWTEARPADGYTVPDEAYYNSLFDLAGDKQKALRIIKKFAR